MLDVLIIGAGLSGLSAGVVLAQAGLSFAIVDSAPQVGGRARAVNLKLEGTSVTVDSGQHLLTGAYHSCLKLVSICNQKMPKNRVIELERSPFCLTDTEGFSLSFYPLPAPFNLLGGLIGACGLSLREKISLVGFFLFMRKADARFLEKETVHSLLVRLKQPFSLIGRIWAPLCLAALNTEYTEACAKTFFYVLQDTLLGKASDSDFLLPKTGNLSDCLVSPAENFIVQAGGDIRLRTTVKQLVKMTNVTSGAYWKICTTKESFESKQLVIATPPKRAKELLAIFPQGTKALLEGFQESSIGTLFLIWQAPCLLPKCVLLKENYNVLHVGQWFFDRGFIQVKDELMRIGAVVISAYERFNTKNREAIAWGILDQLRSTLRIPFPVSWRLIVEKNAAFRCTPCRPKLSVDSLSQTDSSVWLAGDYAFERYPATLESAVRSGFIAAERCLFNR